MNRPRISFVAAIGEDRGLGKNNGLLFHISEDLKRFRTITQEHAIIMGRKTFESKEINGKPLPNRMNIIISRNVSNNKSDEHPNCLFTTSLESAIDLAEDYETKNHEESKREIFIIGGGQIFKEALEKGLVDRLYLTIVKGDYGADTFFPNYSEFTKEIERVEREADGHQYTFLTLEK